MSAQALDRLGHRGVDLLGQVDQEGQGLNITVSGAAAVGAQDAADEGAVLVVLDLPSWPFRCQPHFDSPGLESGTAGDVPAGWLTAGRGGCEAFVLSEHGAWLLPADRLRRRGASSDSCRNRLEGRDCQGGRLRHPQDATGGSALDWPVLEGYMIGSG